MAYTYAQALPDAIPALWNRFFARWSLGKAADDAILYWRGGSKDTAASPPTYTYTHSFQEGFPQIGGDTFDTWAGAVGNRNATHPKDAGSQAAFVAKPSWLLSATAITGSPIPDGATMWGVDGEENDLGYEILNELTAVLSVVRLTPHYYRTFRSIQEWIETQCVRFVPMRDYEAWNHLSIPVFTWNGLWAAGGGARDDVNHPAGRDQSLPAKVGSPFVPHPRPDPDPGEEASPTVWQWPRANYARLISLYPITWFQPHQRSEFDIGGNETAYVSIAASYTGTATGGSETTLVDAGANFNGAANLNPDNRCLAITRTVPEGDMGPATIYVRIRSHTATTLTFDRIGVPITAGMTYAVRAGGVDIADGWDSGEAPYGGYCERNVHTNYYGWETCAPGPNDYVLFCGDSQQLTSFPTPGFDRLLPTGYSTPHPGWQWQNVGWISKHYSLWDYPPSAAVGTVTSCGAGWICDNTKNWQLLDPIMSGVDARPARWQGRYLVFADPLDPDKEYWAQISWNQWSTLLYTWKATRTVSTDTFVAGVVATPAIGWSYRIEDYRPPVTLWNRAGVWRPIPATATDPRTASPFGHNLSIVPTICGNYLADSAPSTRNAVAGGTGRISHFDLVTPTVLNAMNLALTELQWIFGSLAWMETGTQSGYFSVGPSNQTYDQWSYWWGIAADNAEFGLPGTSWAWTPRYPGDGYVPGHDGQNYTLNAAAPKCYYSGRVSAYAQMLPSTLYTLGATADLKHQGGKLTGWSTTDNVTLNVSSATSNSLVIDPVLHTDLTPTMAFYSYADTPAEVPTFDAANGMGLLYQKWHLIYTSAVQHFEQVLDTPTEPARPTVSEPGLPPEHGTTTENWAGKGWMVANTVCIAKYSLP